MNEDTTIINIADHKRTAKEGFAPTPTARSIHAVLHTCRHARVLGLILGDPGVGKTAAALAYREEDADIVYLKITQPISCVRDLLKEICKQLDIYVDKSSGDCERFQSIVQGLTGPHLSPPLLLIDEAQNLDNDALELIRDLFDDSRCGIVMIANPHLTSRWIKPADKRRLYHFQQLQGRIAMRIMIERPLPEDIEGICDCHGITAKDGRAILARAARNPIGQLHNVEKIIRLARSTAPAGSSLTSAHIKQAALRLGILNEQDN